MKDGTRVIFWLDTALVLVVAILVLMRQWDYVVALLIGLLVMNYFGPWRRRR
ncbi:MAG: hypothetical protein GX649_04550 [Chloroflexi bacterium]|nr:hypothetical protein [Chloroflexota bacterium]